MYLSYRGLIIMRMVGSVLSLRTHVRLVMIGYSYRNISEWREAFCIVRAFRISNIEYTARQIVIE